LAAGREVYFPVRCRQDALDAYAAFKVVDTVGMIRDNPEDYHWSMFEHVFESVYMCKKYAKLEYFPPKGCLRGRRPLKPLTFTRSGKVSLNVEL